MTPFENPTLIASYAELITTFTGLVTVLGGVYIAIRQNRIAKTQEAIGRDLQANGADRRQQLDAVKETIEARAAEIKSIVSNGSTSRRV